MDERKGKETEIILWDVRRLKSRASFHRSTTANEEDEEEDECCRVSVRASRRKSVGRNEKNVSDAMSRVDVVADQSTKRTGQRCQSDGAAITWN